MKRNVALVVVVGILLLPSLLVSNLPALDRTCTYCKNPLADGDTYCRVCGEAAALACPSCYKTVEANAKTCAHCGKPLETGQAAEQPLWPSRTSAADSAATTIVRKPVSTQETSRPTLFTGLGLRPRQIVLPPRLFDSPTGDVIPSLAVYGTGGSDFGFTKRDRENRWFLSVGLGGLGEVAVGSSQIIHPKRLDGDALVGFRLRVPTHWLGQRAKERLRIAMNVSATDDTRYVSSGDLVGNPNVGHLSYDLRETNLGFAFTWSHGNARMHANTTLSDLRASSVQYWTLAGGSHQGPDKKNGHLSFGLGFDYRANATTFFVAEMRTAPRITFSEIDGTVGVENLANYALGIRFFPDPLFGVDAVVNVDDEALGLADLQMGIGLHVMLVPRKTG